VIVPFVVRTAAVYVFAGSMHRGGALAKLVVRGDDPSGLGQGVSPVSLAPAGTALSLTGFVEAVLVDDFFPPPPPPPDRAVEIPTTRPPTNRAAITALRRDRRRRAAV